MISTDFASQIRLIHSISQSHNTASGRCHHKVIIMLTLKKAGFQARLSFHRIFEQGIVNAGLLAIGDGSMNKLHKQGMRMADGAF